jgi:hypothetical protein
MLRAIFSSALVVLGSSTVLANETAPKLGPNAVPITQNNDYVRTQSAPDFWAFSPFVKPQFTTSACSIASVTATLNGLLGLPAAAEDTVLTQEALLEKTASSDWARVSAEGGDGVTFAQLESFTADAIKALELDNFAVSSWKPQANDQATLDMLREMLAENEKSATDGLMVYFNQGVLTGDWDGPHISLIGAYNAETDEVLILEVDQEWYIPYWSPVPMLLEAMLRPTSAEHGVLEGETGGFVKVTKG